MRILLILLLIALNLFSQKKYPQNYFNPPLKIPIIFSGTFGELRSNHFHSGIDIKTQSKIGFPIYAPADGYVYRIKLKQYGYGKALYIKHPNGYSTVYGHLSQYNKTIEEYVKKIQYKQKRYSLNKYPKPNAIKVKRGEVIAYTGDTGSSIAPHLHYEIRDSKTQDVINPMLFGLTTADTKSPLINRLIAFPLDSVSSVNNSSFKTVIPFKKIEEGVYHADEVIAGGTIGFGINVHDNQDLAPNKNGIYSLEMRVNGQRVYYHDLETFSFAESKYINLLIDYEYYSLHKTTIQKTHKVKNNNLSIYEDLIDNGKIAIKDNKDYKIEIIAADFHGNKSILNIPVKGTSLMSAPEDAKTIYEISENKFTKYQLENVTIAFAKKTVYKDIYIDFKVSNDTAFIHRPRVALNKKFTLTFNTSHLKKDDKSKIYIANITKPKKPYFVFGRKKTNKIFTTTKSFGTYTLMRDTIAPNVATANFKENEDLSKHKTLKVKISDLNTGINDYYATIDNQWVLMEFNHKKGILTYDFNDVELKGKNHIFKIIVTDNVGNATTKTYPFYKEESNSKNE